MFDAIKSVTSRSEQRERFQRTPSLLSEWSNRSFLSPPIFFSFSPVVLSLIISTCQISPDSSAVRSCEGGLYLRRGSTLARCSHASPSLLLMTAIPALSEGSRPINSTNTFLQTTARLEKLYQRYRALTKQCTVKHRDAVLQGGFLSFSLAHKLFFFFCRLPRREVQPARRLSCLWHSRIWLRDNGAITWPLFTNSFINEVLKCNLLLQWTTQEKEIDFVMRFCFLFFFFRGF